MKAFSATFNVFHDYTFVLLIGKAVSRWDTSNQCQQCLVEYKPQIRLINAR